MEGLDQLASDAGSTLSQAEVERLLGQLAMPEAEEAPPETPVKESFADNAQPYDFRNPMLLSTAGLRKLQGRHEEYVTALAARLSMYLRLEFTLKLVRLQTLAYHKFAAGLGNPTHITLFKVEPLRGVALLEVSPQLGLTIVDRLMGGPGQPVTTSRDLSDIEVALLDQAVHLVIGEWCNQWADLRDPRPVLLGHENNSRFLQTSPADTVMLVVTMEAGLGESREPIQIAFPYGMIEPLVQKLDPKLNPTTETGGAMGDNRPKWRADYEDMSIPVTAEWPTLEMTARDLTRLSVGDVLEVSPDFANQVQVRLAGLHKFVGRLGTRGEKWAVEVTAVKTIGK